MCGGMNRASGSPKRSRASCSAEPWGSGTVMATPWVGMRSTLSGCRGQEADAVPHAFHRRARHDPGPLGTGREDPVELSGVVEQLVHPRLEGLDGRDDDVGDLLLEV